MATKPDTNKKLVDGKPKIKSGRPRAKIDLELVHKLGLMQCTMEECSAWLGIPKSTLSTRPDFSDAYKKGKEQGKMSLRRSQWALAKTSAAMAIWLGKQYLGQKDQPDSGQSDQHELDVKDDEFVK